MKNTEIYPIIYHRVEKDIDSNKWWWATCSSAQNAENLVRLLNKYERELNASKAEVERLRAKLQLAVMLAEELSSGDAWKFTAADEKLVVLKGEIN